MITVLQVLIKGFAYVYQAQKLPVVVLSLNRISERYLEDVMKSLNKIQYC